MSIDKREGWLAELKQGDKIVVVSRHWKVIGEVVGITKTGKINVKHHNSVTQYDSKGLKKIDSWSWFKLSNVSIELFEKELLLKRKIAKLSKVEWSYCSADKIDKIFELLFGNEND